MTAPKPSATPGGWRVRNYVAANGRQITSAARQAEIDRELARNDDKDNENIEQR